MRGSIFHSSLDTSSIFNELSLDYRCRKLYHIDKLGRSLVATTNMGSRERLSNINVLYHSKDLGRVQSSYEKSDVETCFKIRPKNRSLDETCEMAFETRIRFPVQQLVEHSRTLEGP